MMTGGDDGSDRSLPQAGEPSPDFKVAKPFGADSPFHTVTDFDVAVQAAYEAMPGVRSLVRSAAATSVAAVVVGRGDWGAERWTALSTDTPQRRIVLNAAMRDLPESITISTGPVDAAITAAATALLARAETEGS